MTSPARLDAPLRPTTVRRWSVAALAAGGLLLVGGCTAGPVAETGATPSSAGSATTAAGASPTVPTPSTPSGPPASTAPAVGATTLPPVGVSSPAAFGDGLEVEVTAVEEVQLAGEGPGEVAGPGTAVRLTLRNGTSARVDLGGVVVGVTYADGSPGDPSSSAPVDVPTGVLDPGASASGVWVFSRPGSGGEPLEISVGSLSSEAVVTVRS